MRIITAALATSALAETCNQIVQTPTEAAAKVGEDIRRRLAENKATRAVAKRSTKGKAR